MKIGYARVSTVDQSIDLQLDALKAAGAERVFRDVGSGKDMEQRTGFADMLEHVREGDAVIVWRLDRLARSLKDLIETAALLESRGVQLVMLNEGIDTTTTTGKLFFQIFGAIAEFERNLIVERTKAGLESARRRGKTGGRKPILTKEKFAAAKKLIKAGGRDFNAGEIGRSLAVSSRTIARVARGEYDRHFEKEKTA